MFRMYHEYKAAADTIIINNDPAGLVGIDENHPIPPLVDNNDDAIQEDTSDNREDEISSEQGTSSDNSFMECR
jgi:hypothetical protein